MDFIREHQLDMMLFLCGVCALLAFTVLITNLMSRRRKCILVIMSVSSTLLLVCEHLAYKYRGDVSTLGYYMVRVSNGLVFFFLIFILFTVTQYLKDLYCCEGKLDAPPISLRLCDLAFVAGVILLVVSQFTDLYYSFDAENCYQRSPGMFISYIPPVLMVLLQEFAVVRYRAKLSRGKVLSLSMCIALPTVASIVQLFAYGVSLSSMALVFVVIVYYIYLLIDMNKAAKAARIRQIEFYEESRRIEERMFEETAEALVSAIDAKDVYTHGHSSRVAAYSRMIAERAGESEDECRNVYFAALLHDVGKIGISDSIIKKPGKLTDEEYEHIKIHTTVGDQILSSIHQSPTLRLGAHYHHERYDGKGYPEGLAGENIPEIARIIAVADAFDAMASNRRYRDALPLEKVKQELINGIGRQFDPLFAQIMLQIIEDGGNQKIPLGS